MKLKLLIILLFPLLCFGQSQKQLIKYADENASLGDFYGASIYYKQALRLDSSNIHLLYKYAESLRKYNNYDLASYYYNKIIEKDKAGRIFKDAWFWLASMQKYNGDYQASMKSWKKVKSIYKKNKKGYEALKARQEMMSCGFAMRFKSDLTDACVVTHLDSNINTTNSEFSAFTYSNDLFFSSLRDTAMGAELNIDHPNDYKIKIFSPTKKDSTVYGSIDSTINSQLFHNANGCFNSDETKFYFTRCDTLNHCEIYVSKYGNGKWSKPKVLPAKVNQKGTNTTQPHVTMIEDKEYLFFSSNRSGGQGGLDIWHCEVLDGDTYSKPVNAGKTVNTLDPDICPYYDPKEGVLYFSSTWHKGFGGFDIFKVKGKPGKFYEPENMMIPVNSSWNDFYYTINKSGTEGFLTSNRIGAFYKKGPTCCNDIWKVNFEKEEMEELQIIETLDDLNKYLPVTLYFHNDRPGPRSLDTIVPISYMVAFDRYKDLQPKYRDEYSKGLKDNKEMEARLDIDDFFKHYVDKGVSDLALFTRLLLQELGKGEKIEVVVKGFASPLAKTEYNVNLTKRRISSLVNYLREYNNGTFIPYLDKNAKNGAELTFQKIPFGEYTANASISDDYYDQRNSIYNRSAALERKIEIQTVRQANPKDSIYAEVNINMSTHDFGKLKRGQIVKYTFDIKNTGNKNLTIQKVIAACGCSTISFTEESIKPGGIGHVNVTLDTKGLNGKQVKSITIIADAFPTTKRLVLTAEVFE
jgi:hypothetical protein